MRVINADPFGDERWERYVTAHPASLVYHRAGWLRVLESDYRGRLHCLLCEDDAGDVAGVLPLGHVRGLPLPPRGGVGARLVSLPRSPSGGPLASTPEAATALADAAVARADELGVPLVLKAPPSLGAGLSGGLTAVPGDTSYVLTLPDRPEDLRFGNARQHGAIRRAVAKAAKLGVEVRAADDPSDLRAWYRLYLETMRRHVVPPRPYRFFRAMWDVLRPAGMMELLLAEDRSAQPARLLAGCILLTSGPTVVFGFNGRRESALEARPNEAIHWHAIHEATRRGLRYYDFGEVEDGNPGLAQFKLKWGAEPRRLYRYEHPHVEAAATSRSAVVERATRRARTAWQRVPLGVTARLADVLYRYV